MHSTPKHIQHRWHYATALGGLLMLQLLGGCSQPRNELQQVRHDGELVVITSNTSTTYYEDIDGPAGMEYELAQGFADHLGVRLRFVLANNDKDALGLLADGKGRFVAAGLTITEQRRQWLLFTPPYQEIIPQLVYRRGAIKPSSLENLSGRLEIPAASSHTEVLRHLQDEFISLSWDENDDLNTDELLSQLSEGYIDYTIANSHKVAINQRFLPELRIAFDLTSPQSLAWAFPRFRDSSLYDEAVTYINALRDSGDLALLQEKYYGHINDFDYVGARTFLQHIENRLPNYKAQFIAAGKANSLDWRLLAAMGYQESHWNPRAVSPTGVRGIMMLTQSTARDLGIEQRTDPDQSIDGGSRYFKSLFNRLPERIEGRDRIWLALAAYNIGFGHLEDARIITEQRGGNPDRWADVKDSLPLLHKRQWYAHTRHGYARGKEALRYVENIRSYYDTLSWYTERQEPRQPPSLLPLPSTLLAGNPET